MGFLDMITLAGGATVMIATVGLVAYWAAQEFRETSVQPRPPAQGNDQIARDD